MLRPCLSDQIVIYFCCQLFVVCSWESLVHNLTRDVRIERWQKGLTACAWQYLSPNSNNTQAAYLAI